MKTVTIRLRPNQDLKKEIIRCIEIYNLNAGFIITCVGSLRFAKLRLAKEDIREFNEMFEIVSLTGTLSKDGVHIHISLSDKNGNTIGGHLLEGSIINTTAEIVIGVVNDYVYKRSFDKETGFKELIIKNV